MADTGHLKSDQLFKGLTRPSMLFGVSFTFCMLNLMVSLISYIISKQLIVLFGLMPAMHAIGYIICFQEPLFMELFIIKTQKCMKCKNRFYHGANSYYMS